MVLIYLHFRIDIEKAYSYEGIKIIINKTPVTASLCVIMQTNVDDLSVFYQFMAH